jgi:alkanesulfonate monooxygenase SsuD/methylene tetrahydromethanopterin reductase-like flavin-dependent oxidoreductase (luciferase family)
MRTSGTLSARPNSSATSWECSTFITDSPAEKEALQRQAAEKFGADPEQMAPSLLIGPVEEVRDRIHEFVEAGVTHFISLLDPPFDHNTIRRFAEEVIPAVRG